MGDALRGLIIVTLLGVGSTCGINKLADRQVKGLQKECHCTCFAVSDVYFFNEWKGVLHDGERRRGFAWGGGEMVCLAPDEQHVKQRMVEIMTLLDHNLCVAQKSEKECGGA